MVAIWFFWVAFIDSPHFFGTYTRTYFDKVEFQNRKKLLLGSLGWFVVGPFILLICFLLYSAGFAGYEIPWTLLVGFFSVWAYWHVVRQHYGFLSLYKKKGKENSSLDYYIDAGLLYSGLMLPFVVFILKERESRALAESIFNPVLNISLQQIEPIVSAIVMTIVSGFALVYLLRQVQLYTQGVAVNVPKSLFLLAVVPLHVFVCYSDYALQAGLLGFGAFVTIFHDFQYHAIVWFHHQNRYKSEPDAAKKYGLSTYIAKSLPTYIGCAVFMGVLFRLLGCTFEVHPGCVPFVMTSDVNLFGNINTDKLLLGILFGLAMHHYFIDQYIWKTSKDKRLVKDLKLN